MNKRNLKGLSLNLQFDPQANLKKKLQEKYGVPISDVDKAIEQIDYIENKLKHMNGKDVIEIYHKFEKEIREFKIEYKALDYVDREVIEIINPPHLAGRKFYKSSGTSRDPTLINYWFPFSGKDYAGRFEKSEDKYLGAIEYLKNYQIADNENIDKLIDEILHSDELLNFGRFIDYDNALISGRLYMEKMRVLAGMTGGKNLSKKSSKNLSKKSPKKLSKKSPKKSSKKLSKKSPKKSSKKSSKKSPKKSSKKSSKKSPKNLSKK